MGPVMMRFARIAVVLLTVLILLRILSLSLKSDVSFSQAIYDRSGKLIRLTLSRDEKYRLRKTSGRSYLRCITAIFLI